MSKIAPCKGCTERQLSCHDNCQKYKEWKADFQRERAYNRGLNVGTTKSPELEKIITRKIKKGWK